MSDTIVKTERFIGAFQEVKLLTVEAEHETYARYYVIVNDGSVEYTSPLFHGGSTEDVIRNCNSALKVVRVLLADMSFLLGEVVGA